MIVVSVDLHSAVHPSRNRHLATIHIANVGGTEARANYQVKTYGPKGRVGRRGSVNDYPRKSVAVLNLVRRAIEVAGYNK